MDLGSVFLILAVIILVGVFISRPFFEKENAPTTEAVQAALDREHLHSSLLAEQDRLLNALQELDFDNALGKIPAEDYQIQRIGLLQQGAAVLRQLDSFQVEKAQEASAEDRLEAVIAARRADAAGRSQNMKQPPAVAVAPPPGGDDDLEELIAARRRARQETSVGFCPRCGKPIQKSDKFCPKCGATLV